VRYANFTTVTRSHTDGIPTSDGSAIAQRALALLERTDAARRPVRLLGVGVHGLSAAAETAPATGALPLSLTGL
jgi:nucleotidyltransferase/DNA polymerase involved in DNA repair